MGLSSGSALNGLKRVLQSRQRTRVQSSALSKRMPGVSIPHSSGRATQ